VNKIIQYILAALGWSATYKILGRVTELPAGAEATIDLSGDAVRVSHTKDGRFEFHGLPSGTYVLTPSLTSHTFVPSFKTLTIRNADITGVTFVDPAVFNRFLGVQAGSNRGGVRR
jgi:hypothetical protein